MRQNYNSNKKRYVSAFWQANSKIGSIKLLLLLFLISSLRMVSVGQPTVTSMDPDANNNPDNSSLLFTAKFSAYVTGFGENDLIINKTGTVDYTYVTVASQQTSANRYDVEFNGVTGFGTLSIGMKTSGTGIIDASSNPLSGGFSNAEVQAVTSAFNPMAADYFGTLNLTSKIPNELEFTDLAFSEDGLILLALGRNPCRVYEFSLSSPFKISTATYAGDEESFELGSFFIGVSLTFADNGNYLMVLGTYAGDVIYKIQLAQPYDISSAMPGFQSHALPIYSGRSSGFTFSSDGLRFYTVQPSDGVREYSLTNAFNLSTISSTGNVYDPQDQEALPYDINLSRDGSTLLVVGPESDRVFSYHLSVPNNLSTIQYNGDGASFDLSDRLAVPYKMAFSESGSHMAVLGKINFGSDPNDHSFVYDLSSPPMVSTFKILGTINPEINRAELTLMFNKPVTGLSIDDFEITSAGSAAGNVTVISGSGTDYTIAITSISGVGMLTITLGATDSGIQDVYGDDLEGISNLYYAVGTANYNVASAVYEDDEYVNGQESNPTAFAFNNDGSKLYVLGESGLDVNEYTLPTPYDVTDKDFEHAFLIDPRETSPTTLDFSKDGVYMYISGTVDDRLYQYILTTPFDVSTAGSKSRLSYTSQERSPEAVKFNADGTKMFLLGNIMYQYTLSIPYDARTSSYDGIEESIALTPTSAPAGIEFTPDGLHFYVLGSGNDHIREYAMSSPYDISSAVYTGLFFDVGVDTNQPEDILFNADGSKMYILEDAGRAISVFNLFRAPNFGSLTLDAPTNSESHELTYSLSFSESVTGVDLGDFTLTTSSGVSAQLGTLSGSGMDYTITVEDIYGDGTLVLNLNNTGTDIIDINGAFLNESFNGAADVFICGSAYDATNASYLGASETYDVGGKETNPRSIEFNSDGSKMFILGYAGDDVNEFSLSSNYDVSSATYVDAFIVNAQDISPYSLTFGADGIKMFILGGGTKIHEYELGTAYDPSTAVYEGITNRFSVGDQQPACRTMIFNNDGTRMYVGGGSLTISEYSLSVAYDVSTAKFLGNDEKFSIGDEYSGVDDIYITPGGKKLLVLGGAEVTEYNLGSAYDISSAVFNGYQESFQMYDEMTNSASLAFNSDGTMMYVLSDGDNTIHVYDLNIAPTVESITVSDGTLARASTVNFEITFSESVTGVNLTDFELDLSGVTATLESISGSGFEYLVTVSNIDGDGTLGLNLRTSGTGISDLASKPIKVGGYTVGNDHTVDRVSPTATITIDDMALKIGDTPIVTITFSEEVENFTKSDLLVDHGDFESFTSQDNISFTTYYVPGSNVESNNNTIMVNMSGLTDHSGNSGGANIFTESFVVDTKRPQLSLYLRDVNIQNAPATDFRIDFTEIVTGFDIQNLSVAVGTGFISDAIQNEIDSYTFTFTPESGIENNNVYIRFETHTITDLAGNSGSASDISVGPIVVDTKSPSFTISLDDETLAIGESALVTFSFSEPVRNIDVLDLFNFDTPNGVASNLQFTNGDQLLTFDFAPNQFVQDYTNEISVLYLMFTDLNGNSILGETTTKSPNYIVDNIRPDINITLESSSFFSGETTTVTIVATEELIDFDLDDLNAEHATLTDLATIDNITFTATLTPDTEVDSENNLITTMIDGFSDRAGNTLESNVSSGNYEINTVIPVITFDEIEEQSIFDATIELTAVSSSDLAVSYTSSDPAVASVSGNMVTFVALGTTTITASQDATASVNAALDVDQDLIVSEIYKWNGTTWNSGSAPTTPVDVVLEGDLVVSGFIETASLYVAPGVTLTIQEDGVLKDNGTINNEGQVVVASGGSLVIMGDASGTSYEIQRNTTGNAGYSIIGAMVSGKTVADFQFDYAYSFDGTDFVLPSPSDPMLPGKGFFAGYNVASPSLIFDGTPNSGNQSYQLASADVYQLVANPYAAPIVHQQLVVGNNSFDGTIYLWDDGGENMSDIRGGGYVTVNADGMAVGSAGLQGSDAFQGNIGSGQGFFIFADVATSIDFTPAMQSIEAGKNRDENFYRKVSDSQFLRLKLTQNDLSDELLVVFKEGATYELDKGLDAKKLMNNGLSFYSQFNKERLAIQTLPKVSEEMVIPLGFRLLEEGKITIALSEAVNLEAHTELYLIDKVTDKVHNLNQEQSLSMSTTQTINENRFELMIVRNVLNIDHFPAELQVFGKPDELEVYYPKSEGEEAITIYTIDGRIVHQSEVKFENATKKAIVKGTFSKETIYILSVDGHNLKFLLK